MDKFFHVFTLHSSSLLCSDNMLSPELSPVLCTAIRLQATNISATLEPLLQTTTIVIVEPCALNAEVSAFHTEVPGQSARLSINVKIFIIIIFLC